MIDPKLIELGKELIALAEKYSEPRTIKINPEPEVKTCAHEPMLVVKRSSSGRFGIDYYKCKHCGAKIRAEKWEAV